MNLSSVALYSSLIAFHDLSMMWIRCSWSLGLVLFSTACSQAKPASGPECTAKKSQIEVTRAVDARHQSDVKSLQAKFKTKVPSDTLTPSPVETRIGRLEFFDGFPTKDTVHRTLEYLYLSRAVEAFLLFVPAASLESMRASHAVVGAHESHQVILVDELLDSTPLFLTGNTDTVYASAILDLEKSGPMVIEVPPQCGPGTVNDAFFRFVIDMGAPGPDRGAGGKYLVVPPDFKGEAPEGYFMSRSASYINWLILRGFLVDGKPDTAAKMFRDGLKIYPLDQADAQPAMEFISVKDRVYSTIHANDEHFYEEVNRVVQREPIELFEPEIRGILSAIGIEKGKAFAPTDAQRELLKEAAAIANATARSLAFATPNSAAFLYEKSFWKEAFIGGDYRWLKNGGAGGRDLNSRTQFFYLATVNTPAMALKMVGKGSQYALANRDSEGEYLDGAQHYTLRIPADVPAQDFWSVVIYDPQTRSELQTDTPFPSLNSKRDALTQNADGSTTVHFSPEKPVGEGVNWIQTVSGTGWFTLLRLYGPLEPWFEKSWRPGEIERMQRESQKED